MWFKSLPWLPRGQGTVGGKDRRRETTSEAAGVSRQVASLAAVIITRIRGGGGGSPTRERPLADASVRWSARGSPRGISQPRPRGRRGAGGRQAGGPGRAWATAARGRAEAAATAASAAWPRPPRPPEAPPRPQSLRIWAGTRAANAGSFYLCWRRSDLICEETEGKRHLPAHRKLTAGAVG